MGFPNDIPVKVYRYPLEFMADGICDEGCEFFKDVDYLTAKSYEHCGYKEDGLGNCGANTEFTCD